MRYNTTFITDRVLLLTTVEADDTSEAHTQGLETISYELGLDLRPIPYRVEYEEIDND